MKAVLAPGQGVLSEALAVVNTPEKEKWYRYAEEILRQPITIESLPRHDVNSAAILANSIANYEAFVRAGGTADISLGYSIGQYAALAISGVIDYEDAIRLGVQRARLMQKYLLPDTGMSSVIGLTIEAVETLIKQTLATLPGQILEISNFNSSFNFTVAGHKPAVDSFSRIALESGAKQARILDVEGAWHSSLQLDCVPEFQSLLRQVKFLRPQMGYVCNYSGAFEDDTDIIRENLIGHLTSTVKWFQSINSIREKGTTAYIESGVGGQLSKMLFFMRLGPCYNLDLSEHVQKCAAL